MADKIQLRRDTAANWTTADPILAQGEEGFEIDTMLRKVGDGVTPWTSLPYDSATDHGGLSGLGDDDHPQYLNEARHDLLPSDNPHGVTATQVGLGNVDNTSDVNKPISTATQTALDLKYDASNPNGYETPAQLNARDTNNRDRSNHTGTQLAATISDLSTAITSGETTTTLSLAANTLTYTDEDGIVTNLDLSVYLDDTNLARLVSGTLNSVTGVVTFTRDDSTTFTIDMSDLLDNQVASEVPVTPAGNLTSTDTQAALEELQVDIDGINTAQGVQDTNISNNASAITVIQGEQTVQDADIAAIEAEQITQNSDITANASDITTIQGQQTVQDAAIALNTAKVSATGSVGTHSDVDITGVQTGDMLSWNGSAFTPEAILNGFTIFPIWAEEGGALRNGQFEWSWGNGATGTDIGIVIPFDCELFATSFNADTFGTSVSIDTLLNGSAVNTSTFTTQDGFQNFTAIPVTAGQRVHFQTNTVVGGTTDARICAWFRVQATAAFPTPDRSTVSAAGLTFTNATFIDIPGLSTTVTLSDAGTIDGILNYSALRSGGTNSEAQLRVVINGNNGIAYFDTLSTFNDNGSASHFVGSLPAGTYTVSAQAQVTQPITITVATLTATAVES